MTYSAGAEVKSSRGTVCGLDGIDLIAERDRLAQLARAIVTPAPEAEVSHLRLAAAWTAPQGGREIQGDATKTCT